MSKRATDIITAVVVLISVAAFSIGAAWLGKDCLSDAMAAYHSGNIQKSIGWTFLTMVLFFYAACAVRFFIMIAGDFIELMRGGAAGSSLGS